MCAGRTRKAGSACMHDVWDPWASNRPNGLGGTFGGGQLGNQAQRNRQAFELVVRPQEELGGVVARVALDFLNQRVLSRDQLLDLARGREAQAFDRAIDTLVSRLRRKLELDAKNPELIKTVWGGGYLFAAEVTHD